MYTKYNVNENDNYLLNGDIKIRYLYVNDSYFIIENNKISEYKLFNTSNTSNTMNSMRAFQYEEPFDLSKVIGVTKESIIPSNNFKKIYISIILHNKINNHYKKLIYSEKALLKPTEIEKDEYYYKYIVFNYDIYKYFRKSLFDENLHSSTTSDSNIRLFLDWIYYGIDNNIIYSELSYLYMKPHKLHSILDDFDNNMIFGDIAFETSPTGHL